MFLKNNKIYKKCLHLYHPLTGHRFHELLPQAIAVDELETLEWEIEALNAARTMDIDHAEAVLRVESGSSVNNLSSKEIKRDLLLFAKANPALFIELANDENVQLRNFGIKAAEAKIISRYHKTNVRLRGTSNNKKLMTVPFDENPYAAFAAFLKTDEGVEIYKSIEKKFPNNM